MTQNLKDYKKLYYETHKEKWTAKTICDICKGTYNLNSKHYHFKSKKHLNAVLLKQKDDEIKLMKEQLQN